MIKFLQFYSLLYSMLRRRGQKQKGALKRWMTIFWLERILLEKELLLLTSLFSLF